MLTNVNRQYNKKKNFQIINTNITMMQICSQKAVFCIHSILDEIEGWYCCAIIHIQTPDTQ